MHMGADESPDEMTDVIVPATGKRKKTRGQSIVEFAMVVPILLVFLLIAADFGRALTAYMTVSSVAAEGASFGSRSADAAANTAAIQQAALNETDGQIWGVAPTVSVTRGNDAQTYPFIEVTVNYTFSPLFSVWPIPSSMPMERTVRMRVLGS